MRFNRSAIAALLVSGLLFAGWGLTSAKAGPPQQGPPDTPVVSSGSALWAENCAPCHGATGRGDGDTARASNLTVPDFTDVRAARARSLATMFEVTRDGRMDRLMPPWGRRLDEQQMWNVVAYAWTLGAPRADLEAGEAVFNESCAGCHGESGRGDGPEAAGPVPDLTDLALMAGRSQADWRAGLDATADGAHAAVAGLDDEAVWQALAYARSLSFAFPARDGALTGEIMNGTTGQPQGGLTVTLHALRGNSEVETLTTQAGDDGRFTFTNLDTDHSLVYVAETTYEGVAYFSANAAVFTPDSLEATTSLNVFGTTESDEAVAISQLHEIMSFGPNGLEVLQVYIFTNSGDLSFVGAPGPDGLPATVRIDLPEGAVGATFRDDVGSADFRELDGVYVGQSPVPAGGGQLSAVVSFLLPTDGDSLTFETPLLYPTEQLNVLVADQGATVESDQAQFVDQRDFQGEKFNFYRGVSLPAGQRVSMRFSNLSGIEIDEPAAAPGQVDSAIDQTVLRWAILGLGLAAILFGLVYPRLKPAAVTAGDAGLKSERDRLLFTLVRLDEVYAQGELDEGTYRQARAQYKSRLRRVMQQLGLAEDA